MSDAQRNHGLWLGPLLAFVGTASYFTVITRWRSLSDVPWLNLAVLAVAIGLSLRALVIAWGRGGALRRVLAVAGSALSLFFASGLVFYVFSMSYGLPDSALALPAGQPVPALTLVDDDGRSVDLSDVGRGDIVLVFYRGYW